VAKWRRWGVVKGEQVISGRGLTALVALVALKSAALAVVERQEAILQFFQDLPILVYLGYVLAGVAGIVASQRYHRVAAHHSCYALVMTALELTGDVVMIPWIALTAGEVPMVKFQKTATNEALVNACSSFKEYCCTPYLRNPYLAFVYLTIMELVPLPAAEVDRIRRQKLTMPDGGVVCLDWIEDGRKDAEVERVLFVASTWTGDALALPIRLLVNRFVAEGWRVVVMTKRGCGLRMPNPLVTERAFHLGIDSDLITAIEVVAERHPGAFIGGAGISKGASELRAYVAAMGKGSRLHAAVALDAASDWNEVIASVDDTLPAISPILAEAALLGPKQYQAAHKTRDVFAKFGVKNSLRDLVKKALAPSQGFSAEKSELFMHTCNPGDMAGVAVPLLEVLTINDLLIPPKIVEEGMNMHRANPHVINLTTRWGTHALRFQGWRARCWLQQVSCEFLTAAYQQRRLARA